MTREPSTETDPTIGLRSEEVAERVARGAVNDVPATPTRTVRQIVLANVMTVPGSQTFFALALPPLVVWLAGIGIAALTWFFARLFVPTVKPGMQLGEDASP